MISTPLSQFPDRFKPLHVVVQRVEYIEHWRGSTKESSPLRVIDTCLILPSQLAWLMDKEESVIRVLFSLIKNNPHQ